MKSSFHIHGGHIQYQHIHGPYLFIKRDNVLFPFFSNFFMQTAISCKRKFLQANKYICVYHIYIFFKAMDKPILMWKGKTFSQITSTLMRNNTYVPNDVSIYHPLPWKHYRKEIHPTQENKRTAMIDFETPGGTIVTKQVCTAPYSTMIDTLVPKCISVSTVQSSKYLQNLSQQNDARRRVRSSGMQRPRFKPAEQNNVAEYHYNAEQYLRSRNRTFQQNQFHSARDTNAVPDSVAYSSNSVQSCNDKTDYVPVYYKPNNSAFATQGAVDSSLRLERLKQLTAQRNGDKKDAPLRHSRYSLKDKMGYPNTCTPVFPPSDHIKRSTFC